MKAKNYIHATKAAKEILIPWPLIAAMAKSHNVLRSTIMLSVRDQVLHGISGSVSISKEYQTMHG